MPGQKDNPPKNWRFAIMNWLTTREAMGFRVVLFVIIPILVFWGLMIYSIPAAPEAIVVKDYEIKMPNNAERGLPGKIGYNISLEKFPMRIPDYDDFIRRTERFKQVYFDISSKGNEIYFYAGGGEDYEGMLHTISLKKPPANWAHTYDEKTWQFDKEAGILTVQYEVSFNGILLLGMFMGTVILACLGVVSTVAMERNAIPADNDPRPQFDNQ
jgi:hypothetical protein